MGRNSNKVPICFPPVIEFFNYPPLIRLDILTTFSLSNMIEYLTRVLHPSNRFSVQVTHGLQPPEEAINNLALNANEEMLEEFLNCNINFNLMCYLTAQNKSLKSTINNGQSNSFSAYDDFSLVINISSTSSSSIENQASPSIRDITQSSNMKLPSFTSDSGQILSTSAVEASITPFDDLFEFSSSTSFAEEHHPNVSTVSEMSWNGSESSISSSFMFVSSGDDSRPVTSINYPQDSSSYSRQRFSYAEMLSKGLNSIDYSHLPKMEDHFPPLNTKDNLYSSHNFINKSSLNISTNHLNYSTIFSKSCSRNDFISPSSSLNLPSWTCLEDTEKIIEFNISNLPLWKKYRDQTIPNRDNYYELFKIWYSYPRVSEIIPIFTDESNTISFKNEL